MTPEERAAKLIADMKYGGYYDLEDDIAEAIRAAVAEEREACAKLAEEMFTTSGCDLAYAANEVAESIRARSQS
jgi:hypothetical protein